MLNAKAIATESSEPEVSKAVIIIFIIIIIIKKLLFLFFALFISLYFWLSWKFWRF